MNQSRSYIFLIDLFNYRVDRVLIRLQVPFEVLLFTLVEVLLIIEHFQQLLYII